MKRTKLLPALLGGLALTACGCSSGPFATGARNLVATLCANGAVIQAQLPTGVLTPAQVTQIQNTACSTAFGTTAAPAPAPGMAPIFPGPDSPMPSPVPSPVPSPAAAKPTSL